MFELMSKVAKPVFDVVKPVAEKAKRPVVIIIINLFKK